MLNALRSTADTPILATPAPVFFDLPLMSEPSSPQRWAFGDFVVDENRHMLLHRGIPCTITSKQLETLIFMVRNPSRLLTKEELLAGIWPDRFVEESNLSQNIFWLRKALRNGDGDDSATEYIVTVPGKGYRFVADVRVEGEAAEVRVAERMAERVAERVPDPQPAPAAPTAASRPRWVWKAAIGTMAVLAAVGGWAWHRHQLAVHLSKTFPYKPEVITSVIQNATDDPSLTPVMNATLRRGLYQSPYIALVTRAEINKTLGYMQLPLTTAVTSANEQSICMRRNSTAWVNTAIVPEGAGYLITVEADNCVTGKVISIGRANAENKDQVVVALDSLLPRLREDLGETTESIRQFTVPVENATTGSLEAFKAFLDAENMRLKGESSKAVPLLQRAIQFDPNFQLAYTALGTCYMSMEERDQALAAFTRAYELRGRGTARERFYTEVFFTRVVLGDLRKAYLLNLEWLNRYPSDPAPWVNGADALLQMDRYQEAIPFIQKGLKLHADDGELYIVLMIAELRAGQYDNARRAGEQAESQHLDGWQLHEQMWQAAVLQGDPATAARERASANGTSDEYAAMVDDIQLDFQRARVRHAMASQPAYVMAALAQSAKGSTDITAGLVALHLEDLGLHAEAVKFLHGWKASDAMPELGMAYAAVGGAENIAKANAVIDKLIRGREQDTLANEWYAPIIRAQLALHAPGVTPEQAGANALEALKPTASCNLRTYFAAYLRGQAHMLRHEYAEAQTEYKTIADNPGADAFSPTYPLALLGLARAQVALGDRAAAKATYARLLDRWRDGDANVPLLAAARREMAALHV